ncbi:MAG TPA: YHS domain-containing protein [Chitinophagales bacterium]|nr:YHS domain-containing protein [Chitinophagales bacterium]
MKKLSFGYVLAAALLLGACNQHNAEKAKEETPAAEHKAISMDVSTLGSNKDLVCGMTLSNGEIGDTTSYSGKVYGFCSSECKAEFTKDPQKYLK